MATQNTSNKPATSMAELMARQSGVQVLQKGQIVEGTVKKLTPQEILLDIGAKGDALVIEYDRQNLENLLSMLKVGDRVKASVISPEAEEGFPVVSLRRMLDDRIYENFDKLTKGDEAFEVEVVEPTRGGYYAKTSLGVEGFIPSSQVVGNEDLTGQKIQVKIIEFDKAKKRVIFSQKALSFVMNSSKISDLFKKGEAVKAEVVSVAPYGIFVNLEKDGSKVEGFVHISEVSYDRVENLVDKFKAGDKLDVEVIEVDSSNRRVNLSIKRTAKDTFDEAKDKYKKEDKVKATVKDVKTRGVTLELENGINGFIESSKIPSGKTYKIGDIVEAEVVDVDLRRRVVNLSPVLKAVPIGYR